MRRPQLALSTVVLLDSSVAGAVRLERERGTSVIAGRTGARDRYPAKRRSGLTLGQ